MRQRLLNWLGVVVLLCMMMQGPAMVMAQEAAVPPTPTPVDRPSTTPVGYMEDELAVTLETAFTFFNMAWIEWGLQQSPPITLVAPGLVLIKAGYYYDSHSEDCLGVTQANHPNAYYCASPSAKGATEGGVIIIPMATMVSMLVEGNVLDRGTITSAETLPGFWPVIALFAHEYAHFIQFQQMANGGFSSYTKPNLEAEADCLAGTSMIPMEALFSAMGTPISDESIGDIIEAFGLMGDFESGGSHPVMAERELAFRQGLFATEHPDISGGPSLNRVNVSRDVCFGLYKK